MKKLIFFMLFVCFSMANAQQGFRWGSKFGYVNSMIYNGSYSYWDNPKSKHNIYFGFQGELLFNPKIAVQGEITGEILGGNNVGMNVITRYGDVYDNFDITIGNISLPLSVKYYLHERVGLLTGIRLGYVTSAVARNSSMEFKINNINTFNHHLFFGTEVRVFRRLFLDLRYNVGTSPLLNASYSPRLNFLQIGLGWYNL